MKKYTFFLIVFLIISVSLFSEISLISPADHAIIDDYPVNFSWTNDNQDSKMIPYSYSIYVGETEEDLKLLVNNLVEPERAIYDLSCFDRQKLFWKVLLQYTNGDTVESEINSFNFTKIYEPEKALKTPKEIKIVLNWNNNTVDFDSHFTGSLPNGDYFHMFRALSKKTGENKWPDYVTLSQNINQEILTLKKPSTDTTYRFSVRDYTNREEKQPSKWTSSDVYVEIFEGNELIKQINVPVGSSGVFWNVFDIVVSEYGDVEYEVLNEFTDYYSSVSAFGLEEGFSPPIRSEIPADWKSEVPLKVIKVEKEELLDILPAMGLEFDSEKIDAVKVVLPAGVKLENESVSVFVQGKPSGVIVSESERVKVSTDIMFVLDTTGSMADAIEGVKKSISDFISYLNVIGLDVLIGVVPFDDRVPAHNIGKDWKNLSEIKDTKAYLQKLYAEGGNDGPENPYSAIAFAYENANWRTNSDKTFVLITDAPGHDPSNKGDAGIYAKHYKYQIIKMLKGRATLHSIIVPGYFNEEEKNYEAYNDPREISNQTNSIISYTGSRGKVDLTKTGILTFASNSYFIMFKNAEGSMDDVDIIFETSEGMGDSRAYTE